MDERINIKIFLKTVILFPLFMIFIMFPLCLLIVITAFVPKGRVLATKLYEFFGWIGIVLVGVELKVIGAEKIDTKKIKSEFKKNRIIVVAGFQGIDKNGDIFPVSNKYSERVLLIFFKKLHFIH